jgi:hypothetical protein
MLNIQLPFDFLECFGAYKIMHSLQQNGWKMCHNIHNMKQTLYATYVNKADNTKETHLQHENPLEA